MNNENIKTAYGELSEDTIFDEIKKALNLDDNRGNYKGRTSDGTIESKAKLKSPYFKQKDIMMSILRGNDTFTILPTGSGKSACYQGPAMFVPGVTFIVSPLIALIEDQIDSFNKRKIKINDYEIKAIAPGVGSTTTEDFFKKISESYKNSNNTLYKLAYVSPERLSNPKFRRKLHELEEKKEIKITLLIVDEAHCLSQSSLEFRESYLFLYDFIRQRPFRPTVCAFTATANHFDKMVIERVLGFNGCGKYKYYESIIERKNLIILPLRKLIKDNINDKNNHKDVRFKSLIDILTSNKNFQGRTAVFCTTARQAEDIYKKLCEHKNIKSECLHRYHASMTRTQRKRSLENFASKKYKGQIIVATKAMGLGVDINNITRIIHYDIPRTLEDYYQEIGRGARGNTKTRAYCHMLYEFGQKSTHESELPKGSYKYTERWIYSTSTHKNLLGMTIASRLTDDSRDYIIKLNKERLKEMNCFINDKLNQSGRNSDKIHEYIVKHFQKPLRPKKRAKTIKFLDDLESVLKDVYEFHYGNNYIINMLRWHQDDYELGAEYDFPLTEWSRKKPKNEKFHTIIKTDIADDSAFVVIKGLKDRNLINIKDVLRQLNDAWKKSKCSSKNVKHLYLIADSINLTILDLFLFKGGKWEYDENDALRGTLLNHETNVKGLLPESRYPEWHAFIRRRKRNICGSVGPFQIIRGTRKLSVRFKLVGDRKPDYFDLCVLDAIYTLYQKGITHIYIKKIWEVLSGDPNVKFSRADSKIKTSIKDSIKLLENLKVTIIDDAHKFKECDKPLLSTTKKKINLKVCYLLKEISPLYRYSECLNGEFIRVPLSLFSLHLAFKRNHKKVMPRLLPMPESTKVKVNLPIGKNLISYGNKTQEWPSEGSKLTISLSNKPLFSVDLINQPEGQEDDSENITKKAVFRQWEATIENCIICHYLVHRISIYRGRRRGVYLNFDNMLEILKRRLNVETANNRERFIRKVLAILSYYREIGYVKFDVYINNPSILSNFRKKANSKMPRKVPFTLSYGTFASFWRKGNMGYIKFHDLKIIEDKNIRIVDLTGVRILNN